MTTKTMIEILGFVAGIITTFAFAPQLIKVYRSKSAKDVSLGMLFLTFFGNGLWFVYALEHGALALGAANVTTFLLSLIIFVLKIKYDKRDGHR